MPFDIIIGRNKEEKEKFGRKGLVYLGKQYVQIGQNISLSNNVYLDIAKTHQILIVGKKGSGKCLLGNTLITLEDGSVIPISELENNNKKVLGLNEKLKVVPFEKEEFYKRKVKEIIKLKLRSGKEIKLTPEHPLMTIKGWKAVKELNIKSRIATPRKIEIFGEESMNEDKIKLLAYFIAEGHIKNSWVLFSNYDKKILEEFNKCIFNLFEDIKIEEHSKPGCYRVARNNNRYGEGKKNPVKSWLKEFDLYGKLSKEKFVPDIIFKLKKDQIKLFLNRLFSCDGSIYFNEHRNGWEIDYGSSSKKLINQVHHLLLRFGILSRIRNKKTKCNGKIFETYEIVLGSENITKYIKEIGFFHLEKEEKSKKCLIETENILRNPNVDTIPKELWELYKPEASWAEIGRYFGYKHPKAMRERMFKSPSRQTLLKVAEADCNEAIKTLATSDIFWDEIISIEKIEGEFDVYDISVPEYHNFVANDIIVHNSYSSSVISEEISTLPEEIKKNLSVLFFDTMGVFWTMKFPNKRQQELLEEWNMKPEAIPIDLYVPEGFYQDYKNKGIPADFSFTIKTSELNATDWCEVFEINLTEPLGIAVETSILNLQDKNSDYDIKEIIKEIKSSKKFTEEVKNALENRFLVAEKWGLFSKKGTEIKDIIGKGKVSVLDISSFTNITGNVRIKALVISLISRKILEQRIISRKYEEQESIEQESEYFNEETKQEEPLVWIVLDEAQEFLPKDQKTPATESLTRVIREGRQPGISLILITQQPGEIAKDALTQADLVLSHRLTAKRDIEALNSIMQAYLIQDLATQVNNLPKFKGAAILLDDNSERIYQIQVHPKKSWHGGEAPSSVKEGKKELIIE
ncbi:hypothetical protein HYX16_00340 [Candidatus Woesearchaeota archaeon]|nr:hypothetical protein [Candidatus Woesearchaeota archaeon]